MTMPLPRRTTWHGLPAWEITAWGTAGETRVLVTDNGARIASLQVAGYEWLAQPDVDTVVAPVYGDAYTDSLMAGWDEMAPSITGDEFPDHGEVWSLDWSVTAAEAGAITHRVQGRAAAYTVERTTRVRAGGTMRLDYRASTAASGGVPFLWAAHPQFRAPEPTTVAICPPPDAVVNVDEPDRPQDRPWAAAVDIRDLVGPVGGTKMWMPPTLRADAVTVNSGGHVLTMRWDHAVAPYVGIWVDRGVYAAETVVAVEPSTGYYDDVARARENGRVLTLVPDRTVTWSIDLSFDDAGR